MRAHFGSVAVGLALALAGTARPAVATTVSGGNIGNQTWTPSGNPYVVSGDINVPAGATLTIEAGTDVRFLNGDSQAGGVDPNRIELTVNGTLTVAGTPTNPVTLGMQTGQSGNWVGIAAPRVSAEPPVLRA